MPSLVQDLEGLQKSYRCSVAESILHGFGKNSEGTIAITICALTGIGAVFLLVDHLCCRFFSSSFDSLVKNCIDSEKRLLSIKAKFSNNSQEVQQADYEFHKTRWDVVTRICHHCIHTSADNLTRRDIMHAASHAIQKCVHEKQFINLSQAAKEIQDDFDDVAYFASAWGPRRNYYLK